MDHISLNTEITTLYGRAAATKVHHFEQSSVMVSKLNHYLKLCLYISLYLILCHGLPLHLVLMMNQTCQFETRQPKNSLI